MGESSPQPLRLLAQDAEDLAVLSAHMQDAVVRAGDVTYLPRQRRFALVASRFDWLAADGPQMRRRQTGMHFDHVFAAAVMGINQKRPDLMLNLLGILFEETSSPGGVVTLTFSGGGTIRLEVECIEVQMRDLGVEWKTRRKPGHVDVAGENDDK